MMQQSNESTPYQHTAGTCQSLLKGSTTIHSFVAPQLVDGKQATHTEPQSPAPSSIATVVSSLLGPEQKYIVFSCHDGDTRPWDAGLQHQDSMNEYSNSSFVTSSQQQMVKVMCDLPVPSTTMGLPSEDLCETKDSTSGTKNVVVLKTQPVEVLLQSTDIALNDKKRPYPEYEGKQKTNGRPHRMRIGRPRKSQVVMLQSVGACSSSEMKCLVCNRVFPRVKSLEAHMRIHTGESTHRRFRTMVSMSETDCGSTYICIV